MMHRRQSGFDFAILSATFLLQSSTRPPMLAFSIVIPACKDLHWKFVKAEQVKATHAVEEQSD